MRIDGMYIPDLIADEILGSSGAYSGRGVIDIKRTGVTTTTATTTGTTTEQPSKSDPTVPILWIGAFTSLSGLGLQVAKFSQERKG